MKWLGQYIQDLPSSFRDGIYLEGGLILDGNKSVTPGDGAMIHLDANEITDSNTSGSGTAAKYTHVSLEGPRLHATNSSVTTTKAATLHILGPPTAGTNQTLTNNYSLWVDSGDAQFDGGISVDGAAVLPGLTTIGTDGDTLEILGDVLGMTNTTTNKPQIKLVNNTDDATSPRLTFWNQRIDSSVTQDGEDDDVLGTINFWGFDDGTPNSQQYARIYADIHDATSGEESGRLILQVANHDGQQGSGLILTGGSEDNEIDVTLGLGANSVVTIPGSIASDVTGDLTGDVLTATQANITTLAGLTAMGNANNLVMSYSDIQWYNDVNGGHPQLSIGSGVNERGIIQAIYDSGAKTLRYMKYNTILASGTANQGHHHFLVDDVDILKIQDGGIKFAANKGIAIDGTDILTDSSGTATLSNIDALDATTRATIGGRQFVNLKGYCVLEDDNYLFAEDFTDAQAPWQLAQDYTSGTINSSTEVAQTLLFKAGGFHVPVACVMNSIQVQAAVNGSGGGNITVAIVEYRPSEHADDRDDYPRTVYEEVVVASNNNASKIKTVSVASGALDNTAIPAGSHLLIMVKGDGDTDGDTAQVSVAIEITW